MRFLFRLDLSLHASAEKKIWNFEFGNQTRPISFPGGKYCARQHSFSAHPSKGLFGSGAARNGAIRSRVCFASLGAERFL